MRGHSARARMCEISRTGSCILSWMAARMRMSLCHSQSGTRISRTRMRHLTPGSRSQCVSRCERATCCIFQPCGELYSSWSVAPHNRNAKIRRHLNRYHKVSQSCSEEGICVAVNYWYAHTINIHSRFPLAGGAKSIAGTTWSSADRCTLQHHS